MKKNNDTNFWISYADLMAGLLFVFILLIGAIIVKYSLLQSESKLLEANLKEEKVALEKNKEELKQKEERIKHVVHDLKDSKKLLAQTNLKFDETKNRLKELILENEKLDILLKTEQKKSISTFDKLTEKEKKLEILASLEKEYKEKINKAEKEKSVLVSNLEKLKIMSEEKSRKLDEVLEDVILKKKLIESFEEKINKSLDEKNILLSDIDRLKGQTREKDAKLDKILEDVLMKKSLIESFEKKNKSLADEIKKLESMQASFDKTKNELKKYILENEKITTLLNEETEKNKLILEKVAQKDLKLEDLLEDRLSKETMLKSLEEKNRLLDDEMKLMSLKLENSNKEHKLLSKDLELTKQKIKSFTGIKVKVISLLKNKLGKNIQIDPKNGSLRLSSNILFDEGEYILKDSSKEALKSAVYDYFKTILENDEINKHIDKIVIEGHTNSKGAYLFNLELSQKRAYSVMDFLLSLEFKNKQRLQKLIAASGRSFLDPIYSKSGEEDQDASRRIEIKFSLKNEEAIKEIANILQ